MKRGLSPQEKAWITRRKRGTDTWKHKSDAPVLNSQHRSWKGRRVHDLPPNVYTTANEKRVFAMVKGHRVHCGHLTPENIKRAVQAAARLRARLGIHGSEPASGLQGRPESIEARFESTPAKDEVQAAQNTYARLFLRKDMDTVVTLPSVNISKCLSAYAGFRAIAIAEKEREIFRKIRARLQLSDPEGRVICSHLGDVFDVPMMLGGERKISLFDYDGMSILSSSVYQRLKELLSEKCLGDQWVLRMTFAERGQSKDNLQMLLGKLKIEAEKSWIVGAEHPITYQEKNPAGMVMFTTQWFLRRK